MSDYAARSIIQHAAARRAVATGLTIGRWELLVILDDSTGDPVGLAVGDGATAGGATALEDALYGLIDGTRDWVGAQTFGAAVDVDGVLNANSTMNAYGQLNMWGGVLQHLAVNASQVLGDTTASNADGARRYQETHIAQTAAAVVHYLGLKRLEHDGAANDQRGRRVWLLNDGADGFAPTEAMRLDSSGVLTVAGGVVNPYRQMAEYGTGALTVVAATTTYTAIPLAVVRQQDAAFSLVGGAGGTAVELTLPVAPYSGAAAGVSPRVRVHASICIEGEAGTTSRTDSISRIEVDRGGIGTWALLGSSTRVAQHRTASASNTNGSQVVTMDALDTAPSTGDRYRVVTAHRLGSFTADLEVITARGTLQLFIEQPTL